MDFYYMPGSSPCRAVLMVAKAVGVNLNKKLLNLHAGDHLKPEFLKLNPQHSIPTLVDGEYSIWESRAIVIYLAEKYGKTDSLYPKDPKKQGVVNQRLFFDADLYKLFADYFYPQIFAKAPADSEKLKKVDNALGFLNTFLEGQTYVAGEYLTIADLALLATISTFDTASLDFSKHANVVQWYENLKKVAPGWEENWNGCLEFKKFIQSY